jgi:hypothetical protein
VPHHRSHRGLIGAGGDDQERGERAAEVMRAEVDAELVADYLELSSSALLSR